MTKLPLQRELNKMKASCSTELGRTRAVRVTCKRDSVNVGSFYVPSPKLKKSDCKLRHACLVRLSVRMEGLMVHTGWIFMTFNISVLFFSEYLSRKFIFH